MGLALAEILMDIEDEFEIKFISDYNFGGKIKGFEDFVILMFDSTKIQNIIKDIPPNNSDGYIDHKDFIIFHEKHALVMSPFGLFRKPKQFKSDDLLLKYKYKLSYKNNHQKIKTKILDIFKERSGYKGKMNSDLRYIEDLGLD